MNFSSMLAGRPLAHMRSALRTSNAYNFEVERRYMDSSPASTESQKSGIRFAILDFSAGDWASRALRCRDEAESVSKWPSKEIKSCFSCFVDLGASAGRMRNNMSTGVATKRSDAFVMYPEPIVISPVSLLLTASVPSSDTIIQLRGNDLGATIRVNS